MPAEPTDPPAEATPTPTESASKPTEAASIAPAVPAQSVTPPQQRPADVVQTAVAAATGSPLIVQLLTVLFLLGTGVLYFRVLGSKGMRVPSRSVK
jgi:hypothetical protein